MAFLPNSLLPPKAPSLAIAPKAYDPAYIDRLNSMLRLYFVSIDSVISTLVGTGQYGGGKFLRSPYGSFSDFTAQTASAADTPKVITFDTTGLSNGVSVASGSRIVISTNPGIYNFQWRIQFQNTSANVHDARVWVKVNGQSLAGSTGFVSIPSSHAGTDGHIIAGWNYLITLNTNDYIELWWETDDTAVSISNYAAASGYATVASVSSTMHFVSAPME